MGFESRAKTKPIKANPSTSSGQVSDYHCVFELAGYNLVLRDGNIRDFDGEHVKWQMHPKQMQW
jgi:hypothetical protein